MAFSVRYDKLLVISISNIPCLTPEEFEDLARHKVVISSHSGLVSIPVMSGMPRTLLRISFKMPIYHLSSSIVGGLCSHYQDEASLHIPINTAS
jgi:hypothetical protein